MWLLLVAAVCTFDTTCCKHSVFRLARSVQLQCCWMNVFSIPRHCGKTSDFFVTSNPALVSTQTPIQWIPVFLHGVKRPGRNANHASSRGAEVKNEWKYTSTPPYAIYLHVPYVSPQKSAIISLSST